MTTAARRGRRSEFLEFRLREAWRREGRVPPRKASDPGSTGPSTIAGPSAPAGNWNQPVRGRRTASTEGAIMTGESICRRVVAWTDGSGEAAHAADWAARHALARGLPLHVLHIPRVPASAGIGRPRGAAGIGSGIDGIGSGGIDGTADPADDVRRIRARYRDLRVDLDVVRDGRSRPGPGLVEPDDILVTRPRGYLALVEQTEPDEQAASRVPAPTVFVPGHESAPGPHRVLLLTGPRFLPAAAAFAFSAAAEMGVEADVVRLPSVYDDFADYSGGGPYAIGPRLRGELAKLRAGYLGLPGSSFTLGTRPWVALRTMTGASYLAVLGVGAGCGVDVRAVYDLDTCPVAIVPEHGAIVPEH